MEMSEKFTSSNGGTVEMLGNRRMIVTDMNAYQLSESASVKSHSSWLDPAQIETLREFFQHERDQELGQWRSAIDPGWTAVENGRYVQFRHDDCKRAFSLDRNAPDFNGWSPALREIGHEWFAAHPEPKPWMLLPEGVYAISPQVHPYERLLQFRDGNWLHLYRGPADGAAEPHTAEWCAEKAHKDGRLTRLVPEAA